MNEHTLPDDFSRWPDSPFELLGVSPGVTERDLRRAYTRLIRTYKPEHFPEHFRRIREAYETARGYAQYYTTFESPADTPLSDESRPEGQHAPATPEPDDPGTPAAERPTPQQSPPTFEDELDEAWDLAVEGDEARAYARLLDLLDRKPERSETYLRLYCLLGVAPELDDGRRPCDFLAQGLRRTGGSGPCHEAYRREVEADAWEALTGRFAALLEATTQPGLLSTFVRWRWGAAGREGRFDVIGDDLPGLRARLADEEEIWLRLLASAADQLAWAPPSAGVGFSECLREATSHHHLQLPCADVFDRLENLERIATGWRSLMKEGGVPADLLLLLSRYSMRPFSEVRRDVMTLLAAVDSGTGVWLTYLDRVNGASPQLLSLFGEMLDSYGWTLDLDSDEREAADLTEMAQQFLEEHGSRRYTALRPLLLAFCLRERIDPDVVAQVALSQAVILPEARLEKLVNDWPLRNVYKALSLFRN